MIIPEHIQAVYETAECLYSKTDVEKALDAMAREIHAKLENTHPLFLVVMVGGLIPAGHLLTRIDFPLEVDYVHASRYSGKIEGGTLTWRNAPTTSLKGRTVLILDDILDGGVTLMEIVDHCHKQGAKAVYTSVLVEKRDTRLAEGLPHADFTGLVIEDRYVFGFGMDYNEFLRNAPGIYAVAPEFGGKS